MDSALWIVISVAAAVISVGGALLIYWLAVVRDEGPPKDPRNGL